MSLIMSMEQMIEAQESGIKVKCENIIRFKGSGVSHRMS